MIDFAIRVEVFLNQIANLFGGVLLSPIGILPEWLAAIAVAIVTGVLMMICFKYTSIQSAIRRVRNGIKAELLALSLFKDDVVVNLSSQFQILKGALKLVLLSIVPMAVMVIPICLLLGQLSLWWQARPLRVGEEAVVTLNLAGDANSAWPNVSLNPGLAAETTVGPVRVRSQRAICWTLQARESGTHQLVFNINGREIGKTLSIGNRPMRVSARRPEWNWSQILLYPAETPLPLQSPAKSIEIQYPTRSSWWTGKNSWMIFWFTGSTISALLFRKVLNVDV